MILQIFYEKVEVNLSKTYLIRVHFDIVRHWCVMTFSIVRLYPTVKKVGLVKSQLYIFTLIYINTSWKGSAYCVSG